MDSEQGCVSCLNIAGGILGLVTSLITIVTYFDVDSDSLLDTLNRALDRWVPVVGERLAPIVADLDASIADFAASWPIGPLISALLVFAIILALRWVGEVAFEPLTTETTFDDVLQQALLFLPLALVWIWVFSGVVSLLSVLVFLAGYLLAILLSIQIAINA